MAKFLNATFLLIIFFSLKMAINLGTAKANLGMFNGAPVAQTTVEGLLTCSATGSLPTAPPLAGVNMSLSCDGQQTTLGQALTNPAGFFKIVQKDGNDVAFNPSSDCAVYAQMTPDLNCTVFPPTGVLQSPLQVQGIVGTAIGNILKLVSTIFSMKNAT